MSASRRAVLAAQSVATLILLALLFRDFDWGSLGRLALALPFWFHAASFVMLALGQAILALRWRSVLAAMGQLVPWAEVLRCHFIGLLFNNLLPTAVGGDAMKLYELGRSRGYALSGTSVFVDRLLGMLTTAALAAVLIAATGAGGDLARPLRMGLLGVASALAALGLALLLLPERWVVAAGARLPPFLGGVRESALRVTGWRRLLARRPGLVVRVATLTVLYYLAVAFLYRVYHALVVGGEPPSSLVLLAIVMAIAILTNVPVSLNGIGLREQLHVLLLASVGIPKEAAVALSLIVTAQLLVLGAIGYAFWVRPGPGSGDAS